MDAKRLGGRRLGLSSTSIGISICMFGKMGFVSTKKRQMLFHRVREWSSEHVANSLLSFEKSTQ